MSTEHFSSDSLRDTSGLHIRRTIDLRCREFEDEWHQENRPTIEDFSKQFASAHREQLIRELIAVEWELRINNGERPTRPEYECRFPSITHLFSVVDLPTDLIHPPIGPPDSDWALKPGDSLGEFKVLHELGRGAMGVVYLAEIPAVRHQVALKILRPDLSWQATLASRFEREACILAKLDHPGIVPLYSYGIHHGHPYLIMKAIHGASLSEVLFSPDALTGLGIKLRQSVGVERYAAIKSICSHLAKALEYLHSQGILHRDIKPSNILIDMDDHVYLTDLSLARSDSVEVQLTGHDEFVGTVSYTAPESLDGVWNAQTDLYSLGLVFLEICTHQQAFSSNTRRQLLQDKLSPTFLRRLLSHPQIPRGLLPVIARLTAFQPEHRFTSASELVHILDAIDMQATPSFAARQRMLLAAGALVASLLIIVIISSRIRSQLPAETPVFFGETITQRLPELRIIAEKKLEYDGGISIIAPSHDGSFAMLASGSRILRWDINRNSVSRFWSRDAGNLIALDVSSRNDVLACYRDTPAMLDEQRPVSGDGFIYDLIWNSRRSPEFTGAVIPDFDPHLSPLVFSACDETSVTPFFIVPNASCPSILDIEESIFSEAMVDLRLIAGWNRDITGITSDGELVWMTAEDPVTILKRRRVDIASPSVLHFIDGGRKILIANTESFRTDSCSDETTGTIQTIPAGYMPALPIRHEGTWIVFSNGTDLRVFDLNLEKWFPEPITVTSRLLTADALPSQNCLLVIEESGLIRILSADSRFERVVSSRKMPELVTAVWSNHCNRLLTADTQNHVRCLTFD